MKIFLVSYALFLGTVSAINEEYCDMPSCRGVPHIGCNNTGAYDSSCHPAAKLIRLNEKKREKFVNLHNQLRNIIAKGNLPGYEPAARMGAVAWDEELAKLAEFDAKLCNPSGFHCINTKNYNQAGQNYVMLSGNPPITTKKVIKNAIKGWFSDYLKSNSSIMNEMEGSVASFTALVNERNSRIGCAMLRTPRYNETVYITICNYPRINIHGETVYHSGDPASGCKSGKDPHYTSLCSIAEKYDV